MLVELASALVHRTGCPPGLVISISKKSRFWSCCYHSFQSPFPPTFVGVLGRFSGGKGGGKREGLFLPPLFLFPFFLLFMMRVYFIVEQFRKKQAFNGGEEIRGVGMGMGWVILQLWKEKRSWSLFPFQLSFT